MTLASSPPIVRVDLNDQVESLVVSEPRAYVVRPLTAELMYRRLCVFPLQERALLVLGESAAGDPDAEHPAIVEAFERGDLEAARRALRANVETGRRISRAAIERAGGVL